MSPNKSTRIMNIPITVIFVAALTIADSQAINLLANTELESMPEGVNNYSVVDQAGMPEPEFGLLKKQLDAKLSNKDLLELGSNKQLLITVIKYRFRGETTRILTGNLTGTDAIVSSVVINSTLDGKVLWKKKIATQNPTIMSKSKNLLERHVKKIISKVSKYTSKSRP